MRKFKISKAVWLGISGCLFAWAVFIALEHFYFSPRWDAIFYSFANEGSGAVFRGPYMTEDECLADGKRLMASKSVLLETNLEPGAFFCGKDCGADSFDRESTVYEIECSIGGPPLPPE